MVVFTHKGSFKNMENFLNGVSKIDLKNVLSKYAKEGIRALESATPVDTGLTAGSWGYEITISKGLLTIAWTNSHVINGVPIAILIQYGHGTRNGGYVQGHDYINPALRSVFDSMANAAWQEVTRL